jgi:crotonobetainyl-CoA:carnitine CoA-transferase CaiB-like acyl-CoA transferase
VAWEKRKRGGRYYTRSRRSPEDGRVLREYVGSGPLAEIVAEEDRTKRELAEAERKREKKELERLEALAVPVLEISEAAEILVRAHLIAAGYHRHKGEYRRARGKR